MEEITIELPAGGHLSDRQRGAILFKDARVLHINAPEVRINGKIVRASDTQAQPAASGHVYEQHCPPSSPLNPACLIAWGEDAKKARAALDGGQEVKAAPIPFDLEAAKAGAPLVTRDGRTARFVSHVPEAEERTVLVFVDGGRVTYQYLGDGRHMRERDTPHDLFMAPKPKRYANLYRDSSQEVWASFATEALARQTAENRPLGVEVIAVAIPIDDYATAQR